MPYLGAFSIAGFLVLGLRFKRLNKSAYGLIVVCGLMLAWRLCVPLASRRYATIITLPAIFLGCYAAWHVEDLFFFIQAKYIRYIKILLFVALPVGLLIKSWHFNPYYNSLWEIGAIARNDAAQFRNTASFNIDTPSKIDFHSGIAPDERLGRCQSKATDQLEALTDLKYLVDSDLVLYIFSRLKPQEEPPLENLLRSLPGKTEKLGERFVNRKKRKQFVLYRYDASANGGKLSQIAEPAKFAPVAGNLYRNPGFEEVIPLKLKESMVKRFATGDQAFFRREGLMIPKFVSITELPGYEKFANAEVEAESVAPINGKYSLRIKSDKSVYVAFPHDAAKGNYDFQISIKSLQPSKVEFYVAKYDPYMTDLQRIASRTFPGGETVWRYEIPITETALRNSHHFWVVVNLKYGEILLDDCCLRKKP